MMRSPVARMRSAHHAMGVPLAACALLLPLAANPAHASVAPERLYASHCQSCHATNRQGGSGPSLLPESLARLARAESIESIVQGRPATGMPAFSRVLQPDEIDALAHWLYTPPSPPPMWTADHIAASRSGDPEAAGLPGQPMWAADPLNLTLAVEQGDAAITVLDGDSMAPIARVTTRPGLTDGLAFSPQGRFAYWVSHDGWITRFDLWNLKVTASIRVGLVTRNLAMSSDGRYVLAANTVPPTLVALNADDLSLVKVIPAIGKSGTSSRVAAVHDARTRGSFIATLQDIPETWEIPYDGRPVYKGLVHDFRLQEAIPEPGPLPVRLIELDDPLDEVFFDRNFDFLVGASRGRPQGQVIHLGARRRIANLGLPGMPHLASAISWDRRESDGGTRRMMAAPNLEQALIPIIDMKSWTIIETVPTRGPGSILRSHAQSPYLWADVSSGEERGMVHVIDKQGLQVVASLKPTPGSVISDIAFDRHGRYALVSVREDDGALIVYDAQTLKEIKRLPAKRPAGLFNVTNQTAPPHEGRP